MDNFCHTLAGAAMGYAGLRHSTRYGTGALMIAANLPDIDVLAFLTDTPPVALRRGWSHGVLAQVLLPVLLTAAFVLLDRWRPPRRAGGRRVRPAAMLALAYAGVLSHVALDWLNTYGVRLLMPFSGRWFYGDAVFIIDPWLWLALGLGVFLARRRSRRRPAGIALAVATAYVAAMTGSAFAARQHVIAVWTQRHGAPPSALMVGPVPANPFARSIILEADGAYHRGRFTWWGRRVTFEEPPVPSLRSHPLAERARRDSDFRAILVWSRFPRYELEPAEGGTRVRLSDMRFGPRLATAETVVPDGRP